MILHQSKTKSIKESRNIVLQNNKLKYIIKQTQLYMLELKENLALKYEPFSNNVQPDNCIDRLVAHRIVSKFHIRDSSRDNVLQEAAFAKYIEYDNGLSSDKLEIEPFSNLSIARGLLHTWFKDFSVDLCAVRYNAFTPGETFISSGGEVSIVSKLFDKKHWTTTANCLEQTCVFIYNNSAFKRAAKQHIAAIQLTRKQKRVLYMRFRNKPDVGFHIFRYLLVTYVLTIVDGARASSVPKSNDSRRFINVEAMFAVILQRAAAQEILRVLRVVGNSLDNFVAGFKRCVTGLESYEQSAQWLHGQLIKSNRFSTIDFSNASDSVTISAVAGLFPKQVSDYLFATRSYYVAIDDRLHYPKKLSSMGNGFTFEVMTVMLFAIASSFAPKGHMNNSGLYMGDIFCRVYGDDVIIPNEFAHQFVETCKSIDFNINEKKTFIDSFFRESCGYFYSDHISSFITSFDFGQVNSLSDCIITCNKLSVIINAGEVSPELMSQLVTTRDRISALVHASRKGPLPPTLSMQRKFLAMYIFDEGYGKKQKRCKALAVLYKHYVGKNAWHFDNCQIKTSAASLVYIPFFVPSKSNHVFTNVSNYDKLLPALYSGKRLKAVLKGKGRWVDLPAFIYSDGTVTLISNLVKTQETWVDRLDGVISAYEKV